jgi:hypothetical protein
MIKNAQIFAAVLCVVLGISSDQGGAASTTLPATKAAATAATSPAPVLKSIDTTPDGPVAVFEVVNPDGSKSDVVLKKGDTIAWKNEKIKVLDFLGDRIRISRPPVRSQPQSMLIWAGDDVEGRSVPLPELPPAPPPLNPALLALGTDELFAKCLAATGTDYTQAKAAIVSRPKEVEALAKKTLDNKDAPWQSRVLAQALAEELADPKAYAAARLELIRVARTRWNVLELGPSPQGRNLLGEGPKTAYLASSDKLSKLLAPYPGLKGEMILKPTVDTVSPLLEEADAQVIRRMAEEWPADPVMRIFGGPMPLYPGAQAQAEAPAKLLPHVRSEAALACARAPNAETRPLLKSLDPKKYAGVLADCDRILQEAATKPATSTQPTTGPKPTIATNPAK